MKNNKNKTLHFTIVQVNVKQYRVSENEATPRIDDKTFVNIAIEAKAKTANEKKRKH